MFADADYFTKYEPLPSNVEGPFQWEMDVSCLLWDMAVSVSNVNSLMAIEPSFFTKLSTSLVFT
jgi:hypothetical protein